MKTMIQAVSSLFDDVHYLRKYVEYQYYKKFHEENIDALSDAGIPRWLLCAEHDTFAEITNIPDRNNVKETRTMNVFKSAIFLVKRFFADVRYIRKYAEYRHYAECRKEHFRLCGTDGKIPVPKWINTGSDAAYDCIHSADPYDAFDMTLDESERYRSVAEKAAACEPVSNS